MTVQGRPGDRQEALLLEAMRIVAAGGLEGITHRSVEKAAGVPHGSVTYWFGSREGLVVAMVDRLVATSEQRITAITAPINAALADPGGEVDTEVVAAGLAAWMDDGRERHLARFELELAAARDPALQERMDAAAQVFWRLCSALVTALGSPEPEADGRALAAMVDGLLVDRLARSSQPPEVLRAAIRRLLTSWA